MFLMKDTFLDRQRTFRVLSLGVFLITVLLLSGTQLSLSAESLHTFNPIGDTHIKSTRPTNNYGDDSPIRTRFGANGSPDYDVYLKFEVSGLTGNVEEAKLRLYVEDGGPDGGDVYLVSNEYNDGGAWEEMELVAENAPEITGPVLGSIGPVADGVWIEIDVTAVIGGNGIYSFAINTNHTKSIYFTSREGNDPPELVITQESVTGPAAPVAAFSGDTLSGDAPHTVNFTDESTNTPTSWLWDFGDGTTSTEQNPSHTYNAAGDYTVTLTATNADGSDDETKVDYITVTDPPPPAAPVAAFSGDTLSGDAPHTVNFTDESTNNPTSWLWDFGDGTTSTEQNPSHTYNAAGDYTVILTATNADGSDDETKVAYITVTDPPPPAAPVAAFSGDTLSGDAPHTVNFTDESTNTPTSWLWDFGDGTTSIEQNPSHTYNAAGDYTVTLMATNADGSDDETKVAYITVTTPPPPAPEVSFGAIGDSHVKSTSPTNNYGDESSIRTRFGANGSPDYDVYLKFEVSGLTGNVEEAKLRLYVEDGGPDGGDVYLVSNEYNDGGAWEEMGLVANNAPEITGLVLGSIGPVADGVWIEIDVTAVIGGNGIYSFAISNSHTKSVYFSSREGSNPPQLVITQESVTGPAAPVAAFSGDTLSGDAPHTVNFTDESTNTPTSWLWDFGDGTTSTEQNPSHTYNAAGDYTVTLTATNADGSDDETKVAYITVTDPPPPAAPVAAFSGDTLSGDAPHTVNFTDESTSNPTSWLWDFGDGNTSTEQNPSHTYAAAGDYTVTLTATNADGSDDETKVAYITVTDPPPPAAPVAAFSGDTLSGDAPHTVNFTDESTNNPTSWLWDFGDGNTSTEQNPSHTYAAAGDYTVTLTATNADGSDAETKVAYVTVSDPPPAVPVAAFSGDTLSGDAPHTVNFTDESTNNPSSWLWDFGDGNTSTEQNPSHTYAAAGDYTVTLTATNADGSDAETKVAYITVTTPPPPSPEVSFGAIGDAHVKSTSPTNNYGDESRIRARFGSPDYDVYLKFEVSGLTNGVEQAKLRLYVEDGGSDGGDVYLVSNDYSDGGAWEEMGLVADNAPEITGTVLGSIGEVGDGVWIEVDVTAVIGGNGIYSFAISNSRTKSVYFSSREGSNPPQLVITQESVTVPPVAAFSGDTLSGDAPHTVNFTDESTNNPTSWLWDFGDGNTSTEQNPSHTYEDVGTYTVSLTATNHIGSDTETKADYITVNQPPPTAAFSGSSTTGNVPHTVVFTDESTNDPTSWLWDFGDGNTSTEQNPSHIYGAAGTYDVSLTVTNASGSDDEVKVDYITVTVPPPDVTVADFNGTPTTGQVPLEVAFTDLSTNDPTSWLWDFGDGNTSTEQNPTHTYSEIGTYTVLLTATNAGGSDGETKIAYITVTELPVDPPVADFSGDQVSGLTPHTVNFTDESTNDPTSWLWDFGDGNTSTEQNPSHTYAAAGTYDVSLTATNAIGDGNETKVAYITVTNPPAPVAAFSGDQVDGFTPHTVNFTDESTNNPTSWLWDFGDGNTSTEQNPSHTYAAAGTYDVSLTATNAGGDGDETKVAYITVTDPPLPVAAFSGDQVNGFKSHTVNFTDESTNNPISWLWDFGDGNTSTEQNPSHTYEITGTFGVSLTVTNITGNDVDSKVAYITVAEPPLPTAAFSGLPTSGEVPLIVNFTDESTNAPTSWLWDFGDGNTSTEQNPSHTYETPGTYDVSLTVSNLHGDHTETKIGYITADPPLIVAPPVAAFSGDNTFGLIDLSVNFTDESAEHPQGWLWDFGDGNTSTEQNPTHVYDAVGNYNVSLTVTNTLGIDTMTKTAYIQAVESPYGIYPNCIAPAIGIETHSWWHEATEISARHVHMAACVPNARDNDGEILSVDGTFPIVQRVVSFNNPGHLTMVRYQWVGDTVWQHDLEPELQCQSTPDEFKECVWYFQVYIDTTEMSKSGHEELRMTPNFRHYDLGTRQYNSLNFQVHRGGSSNYRNGVQPRNRAWYTGFDYVNVHWDNYMDYFESLDQTMPTISGIIDLEMTHDKCNGDGASFGYVDPPFHAFHAGHGEEPVPFYEIDGCFEGIVQLDTTQLSNGVHVIYLQTTEGDSSGLNAGAGAYFVNVQNEPQPAARAASNLHSASSHNHGAHGDHEYSDSAYMEVRAGELIIGEFVRMDAADLGRDDGISDPDQESLTLPEDRSWAAQQFDALRESVSGWWNNVQSWLD